jgi:hypothetical protein
MTKKGLSKRWKMLDNRQFRKAICPILNEELAHLGGVFSLEEDDRYLAYRTSIKAKSWCYLAVEKLTRRIKFSNHGNNYFYSIDPFLKAVEKFISWRKIAYSDDFTQSFIDAVNDRLELGPWSFQKGPKKKLRFLRTLVPTWNIMRDGDKVGQLSVGGTDVRVGRLIVGDDRIEVDLVNDDITVVSFGFSKRASRSNMTEFVDEFILSFQEHLDEFLTATSGKPTKVLYKCRGCNREYWVCLQNPKPAYDCPNKECSSCIRRLNVQKSLNRSLEEVTPNFSENINLVETSRREKDCLFCGESVEAGEIAVEIRFQTDIFHFECFKKVHRALSAKTEPYKPETARVLDL